MKKLNIGLMLPYSTILPLARNFEDGLNDGLIGLSACGLEYILSKEFIAQGGIKDTETACSKLFNYHNVDMVTGILSSKIVGFISDRFKNTKKVLIANNVGAHVPELGKMNEYVFINSLNLWQHAWAAGSGGVKVWGNKGMFVASVYDAGYAFSHMFHEGMKYADANSSWSFSVTQMPPNGELSNMETIFPYLETYQPDFVFGCFCGTEATKFLNEFIDRGWAERTKLIGLPYLLNPFQPLNGNATIYTTNPFVKNSEINAENVFYHLGLQTGMAITEALGKGGIGSLQQGMANNKTMLSVNNNNISIESIELLSNQVKANDVAFVTEIFEKVTLPAPLQQYMFAAEKDSPVFSWLNPYLCI